MLAPVWHLAHDWVARWQHVECRVEISRSFFRGLLPQQKCRGAVCCEHLPSSRLTIELPARTTHAQNQYRIMWQHLSNSHAEKSGSFVAEYHNSSYGQPANIFVSITCSCTQNSVVENQTRHEGSCLRLINATGSRWFLPKWHLCSESITWSKLIILSDLRRVGGDLSAPGSSTPGSCSSYTPLCSVGRLLDTAWSARGLTGSCPTVRHRCSWLPVRLLPLLVPHWLLIWCPHCWPCFFYFYGLGLYCITWAYCTGMPMLLI